VRSSEKERGRQGERKQGGTDKRHSAERSSGNTEAIIGRGQEEQMTDQTRDRPARCCFLCLAIVEEHLILPVYIKSDVCLS